MKKLTWKKACKIRVLAGLGMSGNAIAREMCLAPPTVRDVIRGKTWIADVPAKKPKVDMTKCRSKCKLSWEQVCDIRSKTGTLSSIAKEYKMSWESIRSIKTGRSWKTAPLSKAAAQTKRLEARAEVYAELLLNDGYPEEVARNRARLAYELPVERGVVTIDLTEDWKYNKAVEYSFAQQETTDYGDPDEDN